MFGQYVFVAWRVFAKSAREMSGIRVVWTYQSVSAMVDPTRKDPAGDEATRDRTVSVP